MDDIKNLTAKQAREKLADRQEKLGKVFEEAKSKGNDGETVYDFGKVKCLGDDVKGGVAVAEKVAQLNGEADALAKHAETLEGAEHAAKLYAERDKAVNRPHMPGAGGKDRYAPAASKSIGELVAEQKDFQDWARKGAAGGITLSFDDVFPSDFLAKGAQFQTMGLKTLMATTAGWAPESVRAPGFVEAATRPIQVLDIIPVFPIGQEQYVYMEETTRVHAAAEKGEGAAFAESQFAFTERTSPVRKITDSLPVTDEQLEDVVQVQGYINGRLTFGVRQRLDGQVVNGDATGSNLRGIKNVAGIQTLDNGADPVMDAFFKAMTNIRLTGRAIPTHHLIHPTDWQGIRLTRTADGIYIFGAPTEAGPERLWGLPVVQQDAEAAGWGLTGSFQPAWIGLHEKRGIDLQIGYVGDQFVQGKRTVRADTRVAFAVTRPAAFHEVNL
jgi:HK97 family phage major capsid protein